MSPEEVANARRSGGTLAAAPPGTVDEGYSIAERLPDFLGPVIGWKIGATSPGAQAFLKAGEPIYGRVFAGGLWANGDAIRLPNAREAEVEPEILIRLADAEGMPAAVHIGMEINRPSRVDALALGAPFIVADNAAHVGLVIGPTIPLEALDRPEQVSVRLRRNGVEVSEGSAADVLGNPLAALRWLLAKRRGTARPLRAGDWVATGAMSRAAVFAVGDWVEAGFEGFGSVEVRREVMAAAGE